MEQMTFGKSTCLVNKVNLGQSQGKINWPQNHLLKSKSLVRG